MQKRATTTKRCTKCGIEKGLDKFYEGDSYRDGHQNACKKCIIKQRQIYYATNKGEIIGYHHKFYKVHKERILREQRVYREAHKEQHKEYQLIYRENHKEEIKEQTRKYREEHKEAISKQRRGHYQVHREDILKIAKGRYERYKETRGKYRKAHRKSILKKQRTYYSKYRLTLNGKAARNRSHHKRRAQQRATEDALTTNQWIKILDMQVNRCNVCGKSFTIKRLPTTDHIIPLSRGGGLTFENVQALCQSCNSKKNAKLDPQFIQTWL